jgi:tetrahydromethanopterin S-methyltransferase subunit B
MMSPIKEGLRELGWIV